MTPMQNAGGHDVYALHRLLCRGTGGGDNSNNSNHHHQQQHPKNNYCHRHHPLAVIEAVMQACPRVVTQKQAKIDEVELMLEDNGHHHHHHHHHHSNAASNGSTNINNNNHIGGWSHRIENIDDTTTTNTTTTTIYPSSGTLLQHNHEDVALWNNNNFGSEHGRVVLPPQPPRGSNHVQNNNIGYRQQQHRPNNNDIDNNNEEHDNENENENDDTTDHDDVRYEYPLAIACEYEQSGEIIRLLASHMSKAKPAYRSEVFRSLDFVSLPNSMVRILLEEYAGCVLERGVDSEATEGDDDDCPLEQVLFWWDDPDMMGMEEAILKYPSCSMRDDLCDLWEKLRMMLYAASTGTMKGYDESKESFKVLHHVLRIACEGGIQDVRFPNDVSHALLLLARFIQREKISMFEERDESGSFPIHIAVSGKGWLHQNNDPRIDDVGWYGEEEEEEMVEDMVEDGNDQESNDQIRNNDADEERAAVVEGGVHAGELLDRGLQNDPRPAEAQQQQQEDDEDGEEEDEEDDNADEDEDNEDMDTSGSGSMEIIRLLLDQYPASIRLRDSQSGSLPVHLALQHNPYAIHAIEHLLDRFPRAVMMPDGNGRLAIHLALIHKSPTWRMILSLSPSVLETRDPVTGLLPFQLAAMIQQPVVVPHDDNQIMQVVVQKASTSYDDNVHQSELDLLSTCFYLLRMSPCLASGLADVEPPPRSLIEQQIMFRCKPRVTKLEEENERLRRRVDELERKLGLMQLGGEGETSSVTAATTTNTITSSCAGPHVKKRKSSLREH